MLSPIMQPCEGNCCFGTDDSSYDGSKCGCKQCPNFELCGTWAPPWYYDCHAGRCGNCNMTFAKNLEFSSPSGDTCPVCLETNGRFVAHPANCGHKLCVDCLRESFWPEKPYPESEEYGFVSPCNCEESCADEPCEEYYQAEHEWIETTAAGLAYTTAMDLIDKAFEEQLAERADPQRCPVCRAHLADATNNSWKVPRTRVGGA